MPKEPELELRKDLMVTVGQEIGPMFDGFNVVEVTVMLSAFFAQALRGLNKEQAEALLEVFMTGLSA